MRRFFPLAAAGMLLLTGCGGQTVPAETPTTRQIIAMDTVVQFAVYGQGAGETVQAAVEQVQELERLLDRTEADSQISLLNRQAGELTAVDETVYELVDAALTYSRETAGCFDITVAPVMDAWGFATEDQRVPEQSELEGLLPQVDSDLMTLEAGTPPRIALAEGQAIDLGGIAKGYASDCMAALFAQREVERGWVSLGGNVLAWGTRPDGQPWQIGVQDPRYPNEERVVGLVGLEDAFAVTSGGYQRYFEKDGVTYHHIIDPATGYPAEGGLTSVTVVAPAETAENGPENGTLCDALSTALFVMGEERALDFWRTSGQGFDLILVTEDGRVLVTAGIGDAFTPDEESGYVYETVS